MIVIISPLFRILARLPLSILHRLGAWVGWATWALSPAYRRRLEENLYRALGRRDRAIRNAAIAEAGKQALELPWLWLRSSEEVVASVVEVEGWDLVESAHADGCGILFFTPHLGCFEITAQCYASRAPITVLYRPPRKAALEPLMQAGRVRGRMRTAPADIAGVRRLVKALRSREAVGMLPDQVPAAGEGMWVPFFGRPAWMMTLAARLTEVKDVQVIYCWAERLPHGRGYVFRMSAPTEPLEGAIEARCATISREMERLIVARPEQYLWGYNRYKRPSGVEPPPDGGAC
jgi:KDO2-lipid IV(A) lauroyltransferase